MDSITKALTLRISNFVALWLF